MIKGVGKAAKHTFFVSWLVYLSLCITLIIYYWFYNWYIPQSKLRTKVVFELQNIPDPNLGITRPELIGGVDLFGEAGQLLLPGQEYSFKLSFDIPESDSNFDIGIFGVTAEVINTEGSKNGVFKTTGAITYRSNLLRYLMTIVYLPFYIIGVKDQQQSLGLVLKDSYVENTYSRTSKIVIRVHEKLQFYSASLNIDAKLTGLRFLMYNWYYVTNLILCSMLFTLIFLLLLANFYDLKTVLFPGIFSFGQKRKSFDSFERYDRSDDSQSEKSTTPQIGDSKRYLLGNEDDREVLLGLKNFRKLSQVRKRNRKSS